MAQMLAMVCNGHHNDWVMLITTPTAQPRALPLMKLILDVYRAFPSPFVISHTVVLIRALTATSPPTVTSPASGNNERINLCVNNTL